jgi:hypothetical protein
MERPLHLFISADNKADLDTVVAKIEEIIRKDKLSQVWY